TGRCGARRNCAVCRCASALIGPSTHGPGWSGCMSPLASFSALFAEPAGSPIRELFPYLSRPGRISLAGGYPAPSLLDAEGLAQAASQTLLQGAAALQYGATEGQPALREALAQQARDR